MKVLLVNKFYFPQGGADKHVLQLEKELTSRGHEVAIFAMDHPKNLPSRWSNYFVSYIDFSKVRFSWQGLRTVGRTLHSFEAARKMKQLLNDFQPDVVHIHNIYHQISPSILPVITARDIPIVMTLHDYSLVSANYNLYAHGGICEHGKHGRYWEYILHRCIKHSYTASILAAVDQWWHARRRVYERHVSTFISPSRFLRDLVLDWTGQPLKIEVLSNFIDRAANLVWPKQPYVLFVGRLSSEKGLQTIVRAAREIPIKVKIAGVGPEESALKKLATELGITNIEWLGFQSGQELEKLIGQASAILVPSEWYENCPLSILESFSFGTPVIGTRIGGIPELIQDGQNGKLVSPEDASALAQSIRDLTQHADQLKKISQAAADSAEKFRADKYLTHLETVYANARVR